MGLAEADMKTRTFLHFKGGCITHQWWPIQSISFSEIFPSSKFEMKRYLKLGKNPQGDNLEHKF